MPVDTYNGAIPASGVFKFPNQGNFFFLLNSSAPITVQFQGGLVAGSAANETFSGLSAGLRVQRLRAWGNCNLVGASGTAFTVFYGSETPREDSTDYVQTIATIAGVVQTTQASSNAPTNHPDVAVAATTVDNTIPANAARRSIIIGSLSTNAPAAKNLRVQGGAGTATANGIELQPGQNVTLFTTAEVSVYNPDANAQTYWWQEQT